MTTAITPIEQFRSTLARMQPEFTAALPPQIPADRFIRTVITAVQMNPKFLNADRRSLLGSCMKAAQDGLLLDGREAALVPFGDALQYMPMIGGILKKIRNSGELSTISANVVYQRDQFDYALGDDDRITHKPHLGEDRGRAVAVYAIAKTKDGAIYREVMSVAEVEKVRRASKAANGPAWTNWWDEMARKTAIKRLAKRLPSSADLDRVLDSDNEATGIGQDAAGAVRIDANAQPALPEPPAQERPTSRLRRTMAVKTARPEPQPEAAEAEQVETVEVNADE
jgi:recombination protein RecT